MTTYLDQHDFTKVVKITDKLIQTAGKATTLMKSCWRNGLILTTTKTVARTAKERERKIDRRVYFCSNANDETNMPQLFTKNSCKSARYEPGSNLSSLARQYLKGDIG